MNLESVYRQYDSVSEDNFDIFQEPSRGLNRGRRRRQRQIKIQRGRGQLGRPPAARSNAEWRSMLQRGMALNLAGHSWEVGGGAMSSGWAGWVAERAHGICKPFPLFCFTAAI